MLLLFYDKQAGEEGPRKRRRSQNSSGDLAVLMLPSSSDVAISVLSQ